VKLLVTGANGAVGSYVPDVFGDRYDLILVDKDELDITEKEDCGWIRRQEPDVVLHLAAATDVDECERKPDWAFRTNAVGTLNVAQASRDTRFVYVSTAGVFRGDKESPYTEYDTAVPANTYGLAKLVGEEFALKWHPRPLIVRSGWMFGGKGRDQKFVGRIQNQLAAGHSDVFAVDDKIGSPTYARDLLGTISRLLDADEEGIFHGANEGVCSRYDVAKAIVEIVGADVDVKACSSDTFKLDAPRARSEALEMLRLREQDVEVSRPWRDALAEYLG
jgi:dTDP-4-dehydrorhamnose reductase